MRGSDPGRGALLAGAHARRRRRSALPRPAPRAHGGRGHRARRSARAARSRSTPARPTSAWASPEGELALAEAVALPRGRAEVATRSTSPINAARAFVAQGRVAARAAAPAQRADAAHEGPRLRTDYRYAHDERDAYAAGENYFPEGMQPAEWYHPTDRGLEAKIRRASSTASLAKPKGSVDAQPLRNDNIDPETDNRNARHPAAAQRSRPASRSASPTAASRSTPPRSERSRTSARRCRPRPRSCRRSATQLSKQIGQAKAKGEDAARADGAGQRRQRPSSKTLEQRAGGDPGSELQDFLLGDPQPAARERAGRQASADDNREVRRVGTPRKFAFAVEGPRRRRRAPWRPRLRRGGARSRRALRRDERRRSRACTARSRSSCSTCTRASTATPRSTRRTW